MNGYIRVAAGTPKITVAGINHNLEAICALISEADSNGVKILALPKNCLTSNSLGDLSASCVIADGVETALTALAKFTQGRDILVFVGFPFLIKGGLYSCVASVCHGEILGVETLSPCENTRIKIGEKRVIAGSKIYYKDYKSQITIGGRGANICVICDADKEIMGAQKARISTLEAISREKNCGIIYANAGEGESNTDYICAGARIIAECGDIIEAGELLTSGLTITELDMGRIINNNGKKENNGDEFVGYEQIVVNLDDAECYSIKRSVPKFPFLPTCDAYNQLELCYQIQSKALASRMAHVKAEALVLGVSGGLDSSLALLVCARACAILGKSSKSVMAVTMPGFGTTQESLARSNALIDCVGASKKVIDIKAGVTAHLSEIGHKKKADTTYENAQARYRTMALMDIANSVNGLVVGTGDMSELALGWCTYGGDQISNYNVNAGVPKTLVMALVGYEASRLGGEIEKQLKAVLDAKISPELLPAENGTQDTEKILGDYKLHDFFLYYYATCGASPQKLCTMAQRAFGEEYTWEQIVSQLKRFFSRYFANQFKRSCSPDGVMVCCVSLSPRDGLKMPSDVDMQAWSAELEKVVKADIYNKIGTEK